MIKAKRIFWLFVGFLLLTGCRSSDVPYDAKLFKASPDNCWPCQMYMLAFQAVDRVLDGSMEKICQNSLVILKLGLICWLIFTALRLVVSLSAPDMKKEIASFATVFFKAMIVALFLHNPTYIYDFFGKIVLQPLGEGFLSMANMVLEAPSNVGIHSNYETGIALLDKILNALLGFSSTESISTSKMFGKLAMTVQAIVYQIYDALWNNVGLGFQLWTMKGWSAAVAGTLLITGMLWLVIMIPLTFVDAFIRIGLILILLPLLMVGWVFPNVKKTIGMVDVKKLFHSLFGAFFDILFCCIYITFLVSTFRVYENQEMPYMFSSSVQTTEGGMRTVAVEFGTDFLILTMLAWSMVKLSGNIQDFSKYFFDGAGQTSVLIGLVNQVKNWGMKGLRIAKNLVAGPIGWASEAVNAAQKVTQETDNANDEKQDNSQKAAKQNSAPKPKAGGK